VGSAVGTSKKLKGGRKRGGGGNFKERCLSAKVGYKENMIVLGGRNVEERSQGKEVDGRKKAGEHSEGKQDRYSGGFGG